MVVLPCGRGELASEARDELGVARVGHHLHPRADLALGPAVGGLEVGGFEGWQQGGEAVDVERGDGWAGFGGDE